MNITIVGCGNIGTQFAVHCAAKGHAVTIYCSKPDVVSKNLEIGVYLLVIQTCEVFPTYF